MLKKDHRLTKKKEIDNVFKKGRGSYNNDVGVKVVSNQEQKSRIAIIVTTKVSKKAVERNKLKRKGAHIVKEYLPYFGDSCDVVVVFLPSSKGKDYSELRKSIYSHLKRLKVI